MSFDWLKRYMPRSLYGRAALILVLPVVTLQLVVSIVFIQRHFEDVTEQMSRELARAVNLSVSAADGAPDIRNALSLTVQDIPQSDLPEQDLRRWFDFTGIVVIRTLAEHVPGLARVELPDDRILRLYIKRDGALYRVDTRRERVSASNPHQLLVNMLFFGGLMTLIAFVYLRNQLRPITRLADAAEAFGRGRNLPYSPSGAVEVRSAGHAFLDMRARIERHIEQRTMMLSGVSHDLRTPLTRMKLALSMLDDPDRIPLEKDVEDMQQLIDAFLDFARGEAEAGDASPTDPVALVREVVSDAQRTGQKITFIDPATPTRILPLRAAALRRAVENLVGNAQRYATTCQVSVALSGKSLRIRVEDDGPGIPPDAREDALRPFVRLDPARNQDKGTGVGLGLAIAADIARAHGGVLRLSASETLGGLCADIVIGV